MESETEFKVGDVVCLKSGGEPFTVHDVNDLGIEVTWMDGKKLRNATFQPAQLVLKENVGKISFVIVNGPQSDNT